MGGKKKNWGKSRESAPILQHESLFTAAYVREAVAPGLAAQTMINVL